MTTTPVEVTQTPVMRADDVMAALAIVVTPESAPLDKVAVPSVTLVPSTAAGDAMAPLAMVTERSVRVPVSDTVNRAPSVAPLAERAMILLPSAAVTILKHQGSVFIYTHLNVPEHLVNMNTAHRT